MRLQYMLPSLQSTVSSRRSKSIINWLQAARYLPSSPTTTTNTTATTITCRHMSSERTDKLIFAPGEPSSSSHDSHQAAQFKSGPLHAHSLHPSPFTQFHRWFTEPALQQPQTVPETCTLSTSQLPSGRVSSRMVYLKELDTRGFVLYSNWATSQKARDLESNPHVALCFWWKPLERQVRVEGVGERLSREESQVYFATRARGSRVGAWASRQSEVLKPKYSTAAAREGGKAEVGASADDGGVDDDDDGRAQLKEQVKEVEERFQGQEDIPVPDFWGGLRVVPNMVEFWQGRESRLHDRFRYQKVPVSGDGKGKAEWKIERLNP